MSTVRRLAMPWSRQSDLYSSPGRLIVKLALGEAPESIPASADVRRGACEAAATIDGGPIDRALRHFSDRLHAVRVHSAAASLGRPGSGHVGFDCIEHAIGLSRTFRVDTDADCSIADVVDALRQLDRVEHASPHYLCTLPFAADPHDHARPDVTRANPDPELAWLARDQVRAAEAMAYESGDPAVILAIVDTGILSEHPELRTSNIRSGLDTVQLGSSDFAVGMRLTGDRSDVDTDPQDEVGHGTSCAAIIGAAGQEIPPGLAGQCSMLPMRVLGSAEVPFKDDPIGVGATADIDAGVKSAIDLGAKVLNMSFGTPASALDPNDPPPHADVVRYGVARGCVMIAASGNSGKEERFFPAALDGVVAVGSVGGDGRPSAFSTTGPHVALAAPGERVLSAGLHGYQLVTGTSFAAPFVAAAAALVVSCAGRRSVPVDGPLVARLLRQSARPWPAGVGSGHGAGLLDAVAALELLNREIDQRGPPR